MLDQLALKILNRPLNTIAHQLAGWDIKANQLTIYGFVVGMAAIPMLWLSLYCWALFFIILNRLADGLDGPLARIHGATDRGAYLDIVLDFIFFAGIVFGFALSSPKENGVAAAFLLFSFMGTASSFLAFSIMAEKRNILNIRLPKKGFYYLGGLTEGTETFFLFILFCLLPQHFPILATLFGCCCFLTTATRVIYAVKILK